MKIDTGRLILEPVSTSGIDKIYAIFTDETVRRYLFDDTILSLSQIQSFIEDSIRSFNEKEYGLWIVKIKHNNEPIGFTGLWHFFDEEQPQLLYALLPGFTGYGYATEASLAIIDYAFNKLNFSYLDASCDTPNQPSHKTAMAIGMKKNGEKIIENKPVSFYRIYR